MVRVRLRVRRSRRSGKLRIIEIYSSFRVRISSRSWKFRVRLRLGLKTLVIARFLTDMGFYQV